MDARWRGNLLVLTSAVSFGLLPIFAKLAYSKGVHVDDLLLVRFSVAFALMGLFLLLNGKARLPSRGLLVSLLGLGGIGYTAQSTLYFNSFLYIPLSVAALILYTYPAFVTASSLLLKWERLSYPHLASLALATIGLMLVAQPVLAIVPIGLLLAFAASLTYTAYILAGTRLLRALEGEVASFYVMGGAGLSFALSGAIKGSIGFNGELEGWLWVLSIAVVSTALAATTFLQGLRLIGPSRASILSLVEPLTSIVAAHIVFGEALKTAQWLGGSLILAGAALGAVSGRAGRD